MVIPISRYYEYWQREYMPWWSECVRGFMVDGRSALQEGGPWTDGSLGGAISTIVYPIWLSGLERHIPLSEVVELRRKYDHGEVVSLPGPTKTQMRGSIEGGQLSPSCRILRSSLDNCPHARTGYVVEDAVSLATGRRRGKIGVMEHGPLSRAKMME
jgi:hypothetical protein